MAEINHPKTQGKTQGEWGFDSVETLPWPAHHTSNFGFFSTDELIRSSSHPGFNSGERGDRGGAFEVVKRNYEGSPTDTPAVFYAGSGIRQRGPQLAYRAETQSDGFFPDATWHRKSKGDLLEDGSTAIAGLIPTSPRVNLATMLGELLTEGLPSMAHLQGMRDEARRLRNLPRKAGENWLAYQFGAAPFVRDLNSLRQVLLNSTSLVEQYIKNAGKKIKRTFEWDIETEVQSHDRHLNARPVPTYQVTQTHYQGSQYENYRDHTTFLYRRQWLDCCFTFTLPDGITQLDKLMRQEQIMNYLVGTRVTPEVIWNLAPWSWAIDWFTNLGSVFKNFSELGSNGLVLEYAYIMEYIKHSEKYETTWQLRDECHPSCGHGGGSRSAYQMFTTERKRRFVAGPFNAGWTFDGLDPFQVATALALGFTR